MKKFIFCSLTVLLIIGCSKTPEEKIDDLFQKGTDQLNNLQFNAADSTFEQIFEIDPASVPGLLGVAKLNEARLLYYDAINNYLMLLGVSTDYEDAFVGLYTSYKNLGFFTDALEIAVYYNKQWNTNVQTKYLLGEAYKNVGDIKRAESYFKQAVVSGYEHKNAAQLMLASTLVLKGLIDDAQQEALQAFKDKSDDPIFYNAAAEYYETVGLIDSSMIYNQKLFEYNNKNISNAFLSLQRAVRNDYLSEARNIIFTLENLHAEPLVIDGFYLYYAHHTNNKNQLHKYGTLYRANAPQSLTGTMYELYARAEISDKLSIAQDLQLLEGEIAKGTFNDEFGSFYHYAMLMLSVKYEKNPGTISKLESVKGIRKNSKELKLELALTKHIIGSFDECYSDLKKIESAHQQDAQWLTAIAGVWGNVAVRKYDKAEETYQKALKADPNYYPAFKNYEKLLIHIKNKKKALKLFDKYPQFEKNKFVALTKTKYFFLNKKYKEGLRQFRQYYPYASGDIVLVKDLTEILRDDNRSKEIDTLLSIMTKDNVDAKLLRAVNAQDNKEFEKSLVYLNEAFAIEPQDPNINILKARALYYTGKKTEAYDLFESNLIKFNKNPRNLLYYSQILAEEGIDFSKAANMARQAAFEGYGTYEYIINLADIYYKMGRYDLCRGESLKARHAQKENPYPYFRLGMACFNSKNSEKWFDQAKENLLKAKKLGLSGEYLKVANKALKKL